MRIWISRRIVGLIGAVGLTILSPGIWVSILGYPAGSAPFPYTSPAIFTIPAAFIVCYVVSILDKSRGAAAERLAFETQLVRSETGIGAEGAAAH